jgi:hypothetical protein
MMTPIHVTLNCHDDPSPVSTDDAGHIPLLGDNGKLDSGFLDTTLAGLATLNSTAGAIFQTGVDTFTKLTHTGTANEITVTNGDGLSGAPTYSLPAALTFTGKTVTGGTFTGGAFNGTLGATTASTAVLTSLTFSGATPRIIGDMTNATQSSRLLFQTSTSNGNTSVGVIPAGSGNTGAYNAFSSSTPDNSSYVQIQANPTTVNLRSGNLGSGTLNPLIIQMNTTEVARWETNGNFQLSGTGKRITGDFTNATIANRVMVQTSTVNSDTALGIIPNGTSTNAELLLLGSNDPTNMAYAQVRMLGASEFRIRSGALGTGTLRPITFQMNTTEVGRISTAGSWNMTAINSTPIGATTPSSGAFTSLRATSTGGSIQSRSDSVNAAARNFAFGQLSAFGQLDLKISAALGGDPEAGTTIGAWTATGMNSTPIGVTTASSGRFTTIEATGNTGLGSTTGSETRLLVYQSGSNSSAITAQFRQDNSTAKVAEFNYSGATVGHISNTGLNNMAIGATTASTGAFTTLSSTLQARFYGATGSYMAGTTGIAIGGATPAIALEGSTTKWLNYVSGGTTLSWYNGSVDRMTLTSAGNLTIGGAFLASSNIYATNGLQSGTGAEDYGGGSLTLRSNTGVNSFVQFTEHGVSYKGSIGFAAGSADMSVRMGGNSVLGFGAGAEVARFTTTGLNNCEIGATTPADATFVDVNATTLYSTGVQTGSLVTTVMRWNANPGAVPATASSFGVVGDMAWDSNYIYLCVASSTWKRVALSTW